MKPVSRPHTASFVILRRGGKVACVMRTNTSWMNGHYGLPSGKVDEGESFTQSAIRETKEETGVTVRPEDLQYKLTMHRNATDGTGCWVDIYFEATSWSGEPYNAEPEKHSELVWLDLHNVPDNTIPSVRLALEQIEKGTDYCEYGWT